MLDERHKLDDTWTRTAKYCPSPKRLCHHYPIHGLIPEPLNPLAPMLKALVHAAETALETDIRSAMVSAHGLHELGIGYLLVESAFSEMNIDRSYRIELVVAHLMAALSLEGFCDDPDDWDEGLSPLQHILAVEYTRTSMNAVIWGEQCGSYWRAFGVNSTEAGYDALAACRHSAADSETCNAVLEAAFGRLETKYFHGTEIQDLGAVLVFGEHADDENLRSVLQRTLGDKFANGAHIAPARIQGFSPDVVFAGSRAAAMFELQEMDRFRKLVEEDRARRNEL